MPKAFEELEVYQLAEDLADALWQLVIKWDAFAKQAVGMQLVRAADSIGANIAEGAGRGTYQQNRHFVRIARGSFNETRHFLRRAFRRNLLSSEQIEQLSGWTKKLGPKLNAYLKAIGTVQKRRQSQESSSDE